jgi:acyl-CoA synthetase (AMP-forming)/AMP-acid ligase II
MDARPSLSLLRSDHEARPRHDSLVAAFEAAARDDAPFVTLHGARGPVARPIREALASAWRWSAVLTNRGIRRGDRVPLLMPTGHAFVEAMLGAMLAGAVPVPLATPMTFGSVDRYVQNLAAVVADCGATVLVTYPRIAETIPAVPGLSGLLREVLTERSLEGLPPTAHMAASVGARDTAFIQYTSGTTGRPKGAVISHGALVANAYAIARGLAIDARDVGASWLPLFHDMGLVGVLLTSICHPYPVHVMPPESFVMHPGRWLELIARVGATLSPAPNFAYDLCVSRGSDVDGLRLDTWRVALNGAEPVHASTVGRFSDRFARVGFRSDSMMPVYGMAEATLAVTFPKLDVKLTTLALDRDALEQRGEAVTTGASGAHHAVSVGEPVAGMAIEIVDEAGRTVSEGTVGEVLVSGASIMDGYFRNDDASASAIVDGRLRSGDLGFVHSGCLYVTGRAKELIIKAGRNIHPADIERVASEVEGLRSGCIAAFGRPNPRTGTDDLVVVAETTQGSAVRRDAIAASIRAELLGVLGLKPDEIRVCAIGSVPRTTSGKVRRGECARIFRSESEAPHARQRAEPHTEEA